MSGVHVYAQEDSTTLGILCYDENATVEDLAQALHWVADDVTLNKELRMWPQHTRGSCYGCTYCCERFGIYLTNIDAQTLAAKFSLPLSEFMAYGTRYEPWKVNRVRLANPTNFCIGTEGCLIYEDRPLICRLYVCAPLTPLLRRVVAEVNTMGEAALVDLKVGEVDVTNPFASKFSYAQVLLRDTVSPEVWQAMFVGGPPNNMRPVA